MAHAVLPYATLQQQGRVLPVGQGPLTGALACYGYYRTADGRYMAVGALEPKFWQSMCVTLGRPDWVPLHRTGDIATEQRLREELAAVFAAQPLEHWSALFADGAACVTPVLRLDEALSHPQFRGRGLAAPAAGDAPRPGQHTASILEQARFSPDEIAALRAAGAVA